MVVMSPKFSFSEELVGMFGVTGGASKGLVGGVSMIMWMRPIQTAATFLPLCGIFGTCGTMQSAPS
jgi:hypothetical protein